ncbi:MAG: MazG nucleotide pyrophosphohydrolase domain-containing protein [bacterium]|nr:MazG nucleotide pyrophosphohydrolase domain-containing protein [bacterium]
MEIKEFQNLIYDIYYEKDAGRGLRDTFTWFIEEVGELSRAMRTNKCLQEEFADVCAWLFSLANIKGIDMEQAVKRYANSCPKCGKLPCICDV